MLKMMFAEISTILTTLQIQNSILIFTQLKIIPANACKWDF